MAQLAEASLDSVPKMPQPKFERQGEKVVASLIPRAKSSKVDITFFVSEGRLAEVKGLEFNGAARQGVNHKDFKSNLFSAKVVELSKGARIKLVISSDFFSKSTQYWVFNPHQANPWIDAQAENQSHPNRIRNLVVTATDGGPLDSDGMSDGQITLIGGPKDSFWGYALGTLFIRFFGIFLVLSVLMVGMLVSGKIFQRIEVRKTPKGLSPPNDKSQEGGYQKVAATQSLPIETVAAITAGLHIHLASMQTDKALQLQIPEISAWTQQGRARLMSARIIKVDH